MYILPLARTIGVGGELKEMPPYLAIAAELHMCRYGMFCILTPVLAIPIIVILSTGMKVRKSDRDYVKPPPRLQASWGKTLRSLFWQLDIVGLLLFVGGAAMLLVTITLANSRTARWTDCEYNPVVRSRI